MNVEEIESRRTSTTSDKYKHKRYHWMLLFTTGCVYESLKKLMTFPLHGVPASGCADQVPMIQSIILRPSL